MTSSDKLRIMLATGVCSSNSDAGDADEKRQKDGRWGQNRILMVVTAWNLFARLVQTHCNSVACEQSICSGSFLSFCHE